MSDPLLVAAVEVLVVCTVKDAGTTLLRTRYGCWQDPVFPELAGGPDGTIRSNHPPEDESKAGGFQSAYENLYDPWSELSGPPFPLDVLSPVLLRFVVAASASTGMDVSGFAICSLAAVAGAIPASVLIHLGGEHYVHPNAWLALVGDPSTGKSPTIDGCMKPLRQYDHNAALVSDHAVAQWAVLQKQAVAAGHPPPPKPGEPISYITDSMTPEALVETLAKQDRGIVVEADELTMFIGEMERATKNGANPSRPMWLRAYHGGPYNSRRIVRGKTRVRNLCVSVVGGIQPDMLKRLRNLTDDGLLQRFVPVILNMKQLGSGSHYAQEATAYADLIIRATALPEHLRIRLDDNARVVFAEFERTKHTLETADTLPKGFRGFVGKLDKVFGYLCAALLVADGSGALPSSGISLIDSATAKRAEKIIRDFIIPHAYEVYGITTNGTTTIDTARALASFILTDKQKRSRYTSSEFTSAIRDLRGATRTQVFDAVAPLIAGGWLEPAEQLMRKEQRAYVLNPGVREHFEARRAIEEVRKAQVRTAIQGSVGMKRAERDNGIS